MPDVRITAVLKFFVAVVVAYSVLVLLLMITRSSYTLYDVTSAMKIVSLLGLIAFNGEIYLSLDREKDRGIKAINRIIILYSLFVTGILFLKFYNVSKFESNTAVSEAARSILQGASDYSVWLSIVPLAAYAAVDVYILNSSNKSDQEKSVARIYIVFNDIVCLMPLMLVALASFIALILRAFNKNELETMINAVVVSTIIASATATKAIEIIYARDSAET